MRRFSRRHLTPDDVVIAVMGVTGAGKSTFIGHLTNVDVEFGNGLKSCTEPLTMPQHTEYC